MNWETVDSSQINEVGYDAASKTLGIRFKPGRTSPASEYHYSNVPPQCPPRHDYRGVSRQLLCR